MKILKVVDTREYEEISDGKWAAIPGSGDARECDRCGRLHEVHAYVETDEGKSMVVGTGCMGLGPEVARKYAAKAGTIAKLNAERERLLDRITARETAEREVAKMAAPEPVESVKPWGRGVEVGDAWAIIENTAGGGFPVQSRAKAIEEATRNWRESVVSQLVGHLRLPSLHQYLDAIDRRLRAAGKAA